MAGTLSRFFASASDSGAFASIRRDAPLLQHSQTLYDQILPSAPAIGADESNARSKESEPAQIWALVAVVATGMTQEIKAEEAQEDHHSADAGPALDWHLVELLAEAGVGLQEFLLYLTSLFNRLLLEPELLAATTLLKEEFTIATLLFEKFRVLWEALAPKKPAQKRNPSLFPPADPEPEGPVGDQQQQKELETRTRRRKLFEGGWLVFLLAKRRLGAHYSGLGQLYNLLLATLHLVITNAQASQATVEAEVAAALSAMGALGDGKASPVKVGAGVKTSAQILETLCAAPRVDPADVSRASEHLGLVLQQLRDEDVLQKEAGGHAVLSMTLFADAVLEANVARLSERYKEDYLDGCGKLDERFFLDERIRRTIMGASAAAQTDNGNSTSTSAPAPDDSSGRLSTGRSAAHGMLSPVRRNMMARRREHGPSTPVTRGMMTPPRHRQHPFHGRGINSPLMHSWQWQGSPGGSRFLSSGASPRPSPGSMCTPVTAAVETNNWVRETLSRTMLTPVTPQLRQFFSDCAVDPTERITRVLLEHSELLLAARNTGRVTSGSVRSTATMMIDDDHDGNADENGSARNFSSGVDDSLRRTKNLTVVLFYRVLEPLLLSERERLRNNDFSKLLNNEVFLAALFACSAEVVLKAHSLITISYPFLLEHLHVNAFHFVTTSGSFVKYAPKLPSALKKHMGDVKNRILDSAVWKSDSALYQLLAGARRPSSSVPGTPLSAASPSTPSLTDRLNGGGSATLTGPAGHAPVLRLFFRMVLSRAASRIYQLCSLLGLDSADQNQIWTAVKECITSHQYLLRDRHLDLIVLCNIYAVCKVSRGPNISQAAATMSFKRLLTCYKQLNRQTPSGINSAGGSPLISPRSGEGVTHGIILESEKARGDIIKFYNRCYITPMKVFILQFQCHESQMAAADAVVAEASGVPQALTPGFTPRREGNNGAMGLAASSSDAESIARAASEAVQKLLQTQSSSSRAANDRSSALPSTPPRPIRRGIRSSPFVSSPAVSALQMFTSAEVQTLPVSMNQTSPKRVKSSNVFMSPLQQVRLDRRSELTPRSHALYAIGESPARDLALINRAVNTAPANLRRVRAPDLVMDSDTDQDGTNASPGATPVRKKQKTAS
ncbi:Retinoblastoma-like protein 1 [Phytophthora pseudosyringae]|uniref:Retinoblastoma-like protein 1 n=1 Tax=Phytophthora pseudosyringae TaxID=221518 RepID=A0A8T1W959_9STRA|nr:Retinoblastoma-like protein 1 [Phytophthora pseudosyringae]